MKTFKVLSIDAWASSMQENEEEDNNPESTEWEWNNWHTQDETYREASYGALTEKSAMEFFKDFYIKAGFQDSFRIEDDQYNLVLVKKENNKPLMAIEYGSQY